jgi:tetraacyldisaccharide 4'-kinase
VQKSLKYYLLYPLSLVYGVVITIRNWLFDRGILPSKEHDIPIICVGNLAVGGTGKTPHTEYLIGALKPHFRVAVLSRGYMRKSRGFRLVSATDTVAIAGDEPVQIAMKFNDITVAVDRNRNNGIKEILGQRPDTEVIIMDDGFQHRSVTPGKSIILTEYANLFINDTLLPAGRLREQQSGVSRADIILITKSPSTVNPIERRIIANSLNKYPYQNIYFTSLRYGAPVPVFPGSAKIVPDAETMKKNQAYLLTGIVNPLPLIEYLEGLTGKVVHFGYPDHHAFTIDEIALVMKRIEADGNADFHIFTTEKDAVRLRMLTNLSSGFVNNIYSVPVEVEFLNDDEEEFKNHIISYVRKNKGNNRVSGIERVQ